MNYKQIDVNHLIYNLAAGMNMKYEHITTKLWKQLRPWLRPIVESRLSVGFDKG